MKKLFLPVVLLLLFAGAAMADPMAFQSYRVEAIGLGDTIDKVFKNMGAPQAVQVLNNTDGSKIQLLYFRKEDSLSIDISDLPENRVVQIEAAGPSWNTNSPVKVGDKINGIISKIGKPDKVEDISVQKSWMIEQSVGDNVMRHLVEKNSGDMANWYGHVGLYVEYDKSQQLVKTLRIYDPIKQLAVNVNKL